MNNDIHRFSMEIDLQKESELRPQAERAAPEAVVPDVPQVSRYAESRLHDEEVNADTGVKLRLDGIEVECVGSVRTRA